MVGVREGGWVLAGVRVETMSEEGKVGEKIVAAGGFCALGYFDAPTFYYDRTKYEDACFKSYFAGNRWRRIRLRIRAWLTWDKGWGFPLSGSVPKKLWELMPIFRARRGGIRYIQTT